MEDWLALMEDRFAHMEDWFAPPPLRLDGPQDRPAPYRSAQADSEAEEGMVMEERFAPPRT
ncbi:hypothetical protein D3877_28990 [Azospirillum cavernae]|uniref:Uncharacterized protein n=1 Tax=Azospirillum cavernae TaxID=2320860 RepID=A0A418VK55_9PROT|nr:hypothetical protein D3877_28990 [Azospirillum cavernae]